MKTATSPQTSLIQRLITERKSQCGVTDLDAFMLILHEQRMTSQGASMLIEKLTSMPADARPAGQQDRSKTNRYPGDCVNCGVRVGAGQGTYRKGGRGWETLHWPDECVAAPVAVTVDETVVQAPVEQSFTEMLNGAFADSVIADGLAGRAAWDFIEHLVQAAPAGNYAIQSFTGHNDLSFFSIQVNQGRVNPANKGKHFFKTVVGGHADGEFRVGPSFIIRSLRVVEAAGVRESQALFGVEIGRCGLCGRSLTSEWRKVGFGSDCAGKLGL